jgi:rfaE bifunctional protein kinase chain/domain/rfaE bifunctional protein nucleotidyltransferase chain/domain
MDFLNKYSHKSITLENLIKIIGKPPRKKKVILCHGVFDIVHPGHVRHLTYAKSQADIMIVSCTSDKFIDKGIYRPHIPERMRASNLAAFEMVDYVLIDDNKRPIKLLKRLKPDFFAKGFEYTSKGLPAATQEEKKELDKFGGKIIFTPGDIVYSSTKFLKSSPPNLDLEKLDSMMQNHKISFNDLTNTIKKIKGTSVHVVGDTIVDTYTRTNFIGGQTKTPTFSVLYEKEDSFVGGAAIVALHMKAAGAKVVFTTMISNDKKGKFVKNVLRKNKIKCNFFSETSRPTTDKNTFISTTYRLLKVDTLSNAPINEDTLTKILNKVKNEKTQITVFSDFRHGIFNPNSTKKLISAIPKKIFKTADSQVASRWGNITEFKNFDLLTPNEKEARFSLGDQDSTVSGLAGLILEKTKYKNLILKLGSRGIFCNGMRGKTMSPFAVGVFTDNVVDAVGSGDALLAYATLSLKVSNSLMIASILGSIAASCACEIEGNEPITIDTINSKIKEIQKKINYTH